MRRTEMMTAGGATLAGLGVLAGLAIGSGDKAPKLIAQRSQPVQVRTEVIRKTINVYRRAKPHHVAAGSPGGAGGSGTHSVGAGAVYSAATTRSSGAHAVAPAGSAAPVVSTHTSGRRSTPSSGPGSGAGGGSVSKPVTTHTSGTKSSGGSTGASTSGGAVSQPVKTHTSGTTSSGGVPGSSKPVATRSSGGGGHDD